MRRRIAPDKVLYTLILIVFIMLWVFLMLLAVMTSVKTNSEMLMKGPLALPEGLSSRGYVKAWNVLNFRVLLLNSLLYAFAGTALAVIIASMPAYALAGAGYSGPN